LERHGGGIRETRYKGDWALLAAFAQASTGSVRDLP